MGAPALTVDCRQRSRSPFVASLSSLTSDHGTDVMMQDQSPIAENTPLNGNA
tara:strand:- start:8733 stop:8888 length:156 start_codon:yes stop_codon:yes gene_type:complete